MGLQRLTTEKQLPLVIASSDSGVPIGTHRLTPPPPPITYCATSTYVNPVISSSSRLSKIKREEFAAMMQPQSYHDHSLSSEKLVTTDKSKNTLSLINNVNDKTKFERTCVACVF